MRCHSLPNGQTTGSTKKYLDAWREFAKPICNATNTVLWAFDPGISIRTKDKYSLSVDLPRWFVIKINEALRKGEKPK